MRKYIAIAVLTAAAAASAAAVIPDQVERIELPPCPTEDSVGPCYWDAKTMGNGPKCLADDECTFPGRSFIVDERNNVTFLD
jgi:hypothetical protein